MAVNEIELEKKLKEAGNELLNPPSSTDDLLTLLDKLEHMLINVEQAPSRSMQDALLPPMRALISTALLRHSDTDVKVSVTSCINEITRITAPDAPYNDDQMKEIFQLTVAAFEKLSHVSSRCYMKAVSIIDTVAKVRSCLVMLDLELDELIIEMFQHFLKFIRSNHPHPVILAMETIMTLVIDESEDISLDLLTLMLASVRKENQSLSPMAWKLGEKVMTNCAAKLKPYLKGAVQSVGIALDEYAPIVASICQDDCNHVNGSGEDLVTKRLSLDAACPGEVFQPVYVIPNSTERNGTATGEAETANGNNSSKTLEPCSLTHNSKDTGAKNNVEPEVNVEIVPDSVPMKRGRKPNSLMNPDEGYDHSWFCRGRKTAKPHCERKPHDKGPDDLPPENLVPKKEALSPTHVSASKPIEFAQKTGQVLGTSLASPKQSLPGESHHKRGRPKRKESIMNQDADSSPLLLRKEEISEEQGEDKDPESDEKQFKEMSNSEAKQRKRTRKLVLASRAAEKTSLAPGCVMHEKEAEILSEPEEKNLLKSIKVGRSTAKSRLPLKTDAKNCRLVNHTSDEDFSEAAGHKKTKSSIRDETYVEETPKTKLKRKHTPRKKMASETPNLGQELIGLRIKVWWPLDKRFYEGVVDSYDPTKKKHRILYADGDEETLNLKRQCWELIRNDLLPHEGQDADGPRPDPSSEALEVFKGKAKFESPMKPKARSLSKRSGATSVPKMKARRSDGKSAGDECIVVDKLKDGTSRTDTGSKADGKHFGKLKIKSPLTGINSKQAVLEIKTENPESDDEFFGINSKHATAERITLSNVSTDCHNSTPKGK